MFLLFIFASCEEDPTLLVTGEDMTVSGSGQTETIVINTNKAWSIKSVENWCSFSPSVGAAGENTVTITISPNDTYSSRKTLVIISADILADSIYITQSQNDAVIPEKGEYSINFDKQFIEIPVQSNIYYGVNTSVDWIERVYSKGLNSETLIFSVQMNTSSENRDGYIYITNSDNTVGDTVSVHQAAFPTPPFVEENALGVYVPEEFGSNFVYNKSLFDQSSVVSYSSNDNLTFRFLRPTSNYYFCLNNVSKTDLVLDKVFDITFSQNVYKDMEEHGTLSFKILKVEDSFVWLYNFENKIGIIINHSL